MGKLEAGEEKVILETKRLVLRPWEDTQTDAEAMYEYAKDPDIGPAAGWPVHTSAEESREIIRTVFIAPETYAICLKQSAPETVLEQELAAGVKMGYPIGAISLKLKGNTEMTDREDECEMGYWIGKPFWGQGLMPEAARELLRHAFEDLGMQKVWIGYYEGNEKSKRVQEKLDFKFVKRNEGTAVPLLHETRTEIVNMMTREDWVSKHQ